MSATAADELAAHLAPPSSVRNGQAEPSCGADACNDALRAEAGDPLLPEAQRRWAARPLAERILPMRAARHWMASHPEAFAHAISPALVRAHADTLVTELLPLLEAMRFLERKAQRILAPRALGSAGRPLWLAGVAATVHREPLGHVLVIGPSNFPLFLPGVQVLQALVAGNAVTWKPGTGGLQVALLLAHVLRESGLPRGVLHVTDESVSAAQEALAQGPDKVVFTGSHSTGQEILRTLAATGTPSVMELSGADAVVVLPSADLAAVTRALTFGLRLNGGEVCMSPRRVVATRETLRVLRPLLQEALAQVQPVALKPGMAARLATLLDDAVAHGAEILGERPTGASDTLRPLLLDRVTPSMTLARTDLFVPVLSLVEAPSVLHLAEYVNNNPYALTAAIFGNVREAEALAGQLQTGTVLINDLIAPTADPRIPFGGRRHSGFGVTRGAEGLLEMTAAKSVLVRRKPLTRHYDPLGPKDLPMFSRLLGALHGGSLGDRWRAFLALTRAARERGA